MSKNNIREFNQDDYHGFMGANPWTENEAPLISDEVEFDAQDCDANDGTVYLVASAHEHYNDPSCIESGSVIEAYFSYEIGDPDDEEEEMETIEEIWALNLPLRNQELVKCIMHGIFDRWMRDENFDPSQAELLGFVQTF